MHRNIKKISVVGCSLIFALVGVSFSAQASVITGHWAVSDLLSSKTCSLQLDDGPAESGYGNALQVSGCQQLYGPMQDASAWQWTYEDGLSLYDDDGKRVMQFDLDELDGLSAVGPSSPFLVMQPVLIDSRAPDLSPLIEKAVVVTAQR